MLYQAKQDLDFWEAWVEFDPMHPNNFGVLYVLGEVKVDKRSPKPSMNKAPLCEPNQLVLNLNLGKLAKSGRTKEVIYSEPVQDINKYDSIYVYAGEELIAHISDIEIVV